jgi:hypothetical protein
MSVRAEPHDMNRGMGAGTTQRRYRMGAAALGWFAIILQYTLIVRYETNGDLVAAAIRFSSYFSDLSNVLVALAMTLPWLAPDAILARFFTRPSVRTAILAYIIIVAVIYHFLLAKLWNPQGWELVADTIEHIVAPALYIIDWVLFVPKGTMKFKSAFIWLVFPFAYAVYSLIHGAITGFYPYPFIDVSKLGYDKVFANMAVLILVFAGLGLLLISVDRWLGRRREKTANA